MCPITIMRTNSKTEWGAPGEIAAKKAAEECVAISGLTGWGCPAPVIWKVLHLSLGSRHWAHQLSLANKHYAG